MKDKINVVYYLNKKLNPKKNSKGENCYPVYLRFSIARTNHRVSFKKIGYLSSEEELLKCKELLELETKNINDFIKSNNGKFDAIKYNIYLYSINEFDRGGAVNNFSNIILKEQLNKVKKIIDNRNSTLIENENFINNTDKLVSIFNEFKNVVDNLEEWNKTAK